MRAERRLGELIAAQKETVGLQRGRLLRGAKREPRDTRPTLAAVPDDQFEGMLGEWRERGGVH